MGCNEIFNDHLIANLMQGILVKFLLYQAVLTHISLTSTATYVMTAILLAIVFDTRKLQLPACGTMTTVHKLMDRQTLVAKCKSGIQ